MRLIVVLTYLDIALLWLRRGIITSRDFGIDYIYFFTCFFYNYFDININMIITKDMMDQKLDLILIETPMREEMLVNASF